MRVTLPWPPRILWPNSGRAHWAPLRRAQDAYGKAAWALTMEATTAAERAALAACEVLPLRMTFFPPRQAPDDDNAIAAMKHGRDGIALALGVDDRRFRLAAPVIAESVRAGRVLVEISAS